MVEDWHEAPESAVLLVVLDACFHIVGRLWKEGTPLQKRRLYMHLADVVDHCGVCFEIPLPRQYHICGVACGYESSYNRAHRGEIRMGSYRLCSSRYIFDHTTCDALLKLGEEIVES